MLSVPEVCVRSLEFFKPMWQIAANRTKFGRGTLNFFYADVPQTAKYALT